MHSEVRIAGWWTLYAFLLLLISGVLYTKLPPPESPRLWVEAAPPARFEPDGKVELTFKVGAPALRKLEVAYALEGSAFAGSDYVLEDPARRKAGIRIGETQSAPLILRKKPASDAALDEDLRKELAKVVVSLKPLEGYTLDPRDAQLELPIEVLRPAPTDPYTITLSLDGKKVNSFTFSESDTEVSVEFNLDRPAKRPISFRYKLGGKARRGVDYVVVNPPADDRLRIERDKKQAVLTLRCQPLDEIARGLGDRSIDVSWVSDPPRLRPEGAEMARITVPDPRARLTWSVDPSGPLDPRKESSATLRLRLDKKINDAVTVRYTATPEPSDLTFVGPAPASGAAPSIGLKRDEKSSAPQVFTFPDDDLVTGDTRRLRLQPIEVAPDSLADPKELGTLDIVLAEPRRLGGTVLILVVFTHELTEQSRTILDELARGVRGKEASLVGQTLYVLAGDRKIYRMRPGPDALKDRRPFGADAAPETILNAAKHGVDSQFERRADSKMTLLIWYDLDGKSPPGQERFDGFPGIAWRVLYIGPKFSSKIGLAYQLERYLPGDTNNQRFNALEKPNGLGATIRRLLP